MNKRCTCPAGECLVKDLKMGGSVCMKAHRQALGMGPPPVLSVSKPAVLPHTRIIIVSSRDAGVVDYE